MNEQDKKALIDEMKKERDDLLTEGGIIFLLTDVVRKKARELRDSHKGRKIEGKKLMMISVLERGESGVYRVIVNNKEHTLSEKGLDEMTEALALIKDCGYGVEKLKDEDLGYCTTKPKIAFQITM